MYRSFVRVVAALLLVALVPVELGGSVAAESMLEAGTAVDHHELEEMHVEQTSPDVIDMLEIEDDDAWFAIVGACASTTRPIVPPATDSPAHVHLDDLERPPRG